MRPFSPVARTLLVALLLVPAPAWADIAPAPGVSPPDPALQCGEERRVIMGLDRGGLPACLQTIPDRLAMQVRGQNIALINGCDAAWVVRCSADFGVSADCGIRQTLAAGTSGLLAVGDETRDLLATGPTEHRLQVSWERRVGECEQGCQAAGGVPESGMVLVPAMLGWFLRRRCRTRQPRM
jgi:hypothetical protein